MDRLRTLQPELDRDKLALVTFDLGHTLIWPEYDTLAKTLTEHFGRPATATAVIKAEQSFRRQVMPFATEPHPQAPDIPRNAFDYYAHLVKYSIGPDIDPADQALLRFARRAHDYHLRNNWFMALGPDAVPALEMLKRRYRLGAISNAHGTLDRDLRHLGIRDHFEFVADSEILGFCKPDPKIFRLVLEWADIKPEQALHVGDHPVADMRGALEVGMHAVHYDAQGVFRNALLPHVPTYRNLVDLAEDLVC